MGNSCTLKKQMPKPVLKPKPVPVPIPYEAVKFSLDGYETDARVVRVVNGDTVELIFKFRGEYSKWVCRILDIDAPEPRGGTDAEKQKGIQSKKFLKELIDGKIVRIYCKYFGPYWRLLVSIELDGEDVGDTLISNGFAVPYY
jgi:endonuclease YncB( thermonuclease family)